MRKVISPRVAPAYAAIWWDGSPEAWDEICAMPWDDCWVTKNRPGEMYVHGYPWTIPVSHWVFVGEGGRLDWLADEEVIEVGGAT